MRSFFPISAKVHDYKTFFLSIVLYLLITLATGFALGFFTGIPAIGAVIGFVSQLIDLYCWGGMVVSILILFKLV